MYMCWVVVLVGGLIECFFVLIFFFEWYGDHRDLHVLTHSCPTRRSAELEAIVHAGHDDPVGDPLGVEAVRAYQQDRNPAVLQGRLQHPGGQRCDLRSEEHTSELQSLMRISYAVFCLKKKKIVKNKNNPNPHKTISYKYTTPHTRYK